MSGQLETGHQASRSIVRLQVGIVTTETRAPELAATRACLNDPTILVCQDLADGLTWNHRAAWKALFTDTDTTHALLLQDDIAAPRGWRDAVTTVITAHAEHGIFAFYTASGEAKKPAPQKRGFFYQRGGQWLNEQAVVMTREVWARYEAWMSRQGYARWVDPADWDHHDLLLTTFLNEAGLRVLVSAPSLFQHVGRQSTVGNPWLVFGRPRQAQDWPGPDWDAAAHFAERRHA